MRVSPGHDIQGTAPTISPLLFHLPESYSMPHPGALHQTAGHTGPGRNSLCVHCLDADQVTGPLACCVRQQALGTSDILWRINTNALVGRLDYPYPVAVLQDA